MPSVHPNAATTPAQAPREIPADNVISAPVPGIATITSDVSRNAKLTQTAYLGA